MDEYDFPMTEAEKAEADVDYAIRDMTIAAEFLQKKSLNALAEPFVLKSEASLWTIKLKIDELITFIRSKNGDTLPTTATFRPKMVKHG